MINNEIDEPIIVYYEHGNANSLEISKVWTGKRIAISKEDYREINPNSLITIHYHYGLAKDCWNYPEILCGAFRNFFTFDTKLKALYGKP